MRSTVEVVNDARKQWNLLAKGDTVQWIDKDSVRHTGIIFNKIDYGVIGYYLIEEYVVVDHKLVLLDGYKKLERIV